MTPATWPPLTAAAIHSAARANRASWCSPMADPGSRRDARSRTVARYSLPSSVGISVRSRSLRSLVHPVPERALMDPQIPGHLSDRLARLPDNPDRPLTELGSYLRRVSGITTPHRGCLHASGGCPTGHPTAAQDRVSVEETVFQADCSGRGP
jgi:hypothetical protein